MNKPFIRSSPDKGKFPGEEEGLLNQHLLVRQEKIHIIAHLMQYQPTFCILLHKYIQFGLSFTNSETVISPVNLKNSTSER